MLNLENLQYLLNCIDADVKARGLAGAVPGLAVASKLKQMAEELQSPVQDKEVKPESK